MRHPFVRDRAPLDASSRRTPVPCEARPHSPVPHSSSSRASPRSHRRSCPSSRRRWTPTREETRARGRRRAPSQPEAVAETPADAHHRVARRTRRHRLAKLARPRDGLERKGRRTHDPLGAKTTAALPATPSRIADSTAAPSPRSILTSSHAVASSPRRDDQRKVRGALGRRRWGAARETVPPRAPIVRNDQIQPNFS